MNLQTLDKLLINLRDSGSWRTAFITPEKYGYTKEALMEILARNNIPAEIQKAKVRIKLWME